MSDSKKRYLVTSGLPYANGPIHLGHLVEYIQTDIWVRFQKLTGNECTYICGDDAHGTPIMINAKKQGLTPHELISKSKAEHIEDFKSFHIEFDNYHTTDSPENQKLAEEIYEIALKNGKIEKKEINQLYCPTCTMFLPDRFVKGTCPKCQAEDQYGDSCEKCSATYSPSELGTPSCAECGSTPVEKSSLHYFFKVSEYEKDIKKWLQSGVVASPIVNKLNEWFDEGLRDWDISRDEPYFGFKIPDSENKYFYVWMDAPIGYIAATLNWLDGNRSKCDEYWKSPDVEIHHFIGKDILYFHTLFWPAMLMTAGYSLPTQVNVHGFLTVNGEKMSKSRGTFITAKHYLETFNPEFLRYYYAAKLSPSMDDIDLNIEDFVHRVNSDIIGKFINIASRLGSIIYKKNDGNITTPDTSGEDLLKDLITSSDTIQSLYKEREFNKALRVIMSLAEKSNKFINDEAPWSLIAKSPEKAIQICTTGINCLRILAIYLKPVIPVICESVEKYLMLPSQTWADISSHHVNTTLGEYTHIAQRMDIDKVKESLMIQV